MKANLLFRDESMEETSRVAENHRNRFNVEGFPPHCLPRFIISVVATLATFSIYFEQKHCLTIFWIFFLFRPYTDHRMCSWKGWEDLIPVMNALFFFFFVQFWFSKLRKVRVIQLPLGLLLWTNNPHFKHITKSGSDKRHWREQQNSSTLLWLDCTNYRTGMNKRQ